MSYLPVRSILALAVAAGSCATWAQTASTQLQEETVVTATRTTQTLDKTLAPVEVVTAADIARLQIRDMGDLLGRMTSVNVKNSGGRGSATSIFVRGNNSGHTLVLVDGIRVGSASSGSASLGNIDPATIERVELVRGPRSSLYGSEAIGGVLQIFTRQSQESSSASVRVGAGSNNSLDTNINASYRGDNSWVSTQLAYEDTDGIDRKLSETYPNNDDDAYRNTSFTLGGGHSFSDAIELSANYQVNSGEAEYDGPCWDSATFQSVDCMPYSKFDRETLSAKLKTQWTEKFVSNWTAGRSEDDSEIFDDIISDNSFLGGNRSEYDTTRISFGVQNDYAFASDNILTVGIDYYDDELDTNRNYTDGMQDADLERDNLGLYAQYQLALGNHSFVAGARSDDNEIYGENSTGNFAYGYQVSDAIKVLASWGTAFKAPTFNELYYPGYGNPEIKPEESENYELGIKYSVEGIYAELSTFRNEVDELIGSDENYNTVNINEALIKGVEANVGANILSWDINANYTWLDPKDLNKGTVLVFRPENSAALNLDNRWGDFSVGLTVRGQSSVYIDGRNTKELAGFGLLDIRAAYQATENLQLQLKLDNALDKEYQLNNGYRQDGVNGMVSVTYSM